MSDGQFQVPNEYRDEKVYRVPIKYEPQAGPDMEANPDAEMEIISYRFTVTDLIRGNQVIFSHYRQGNLYYNICMSRFTSDIGGVTHAEKDMYQFGVPISDVGDGTLLPRDKAIIYMRWIRKAMENKTLERI